jgi:hypothetical protein
MTSQDMERYHHKMHHRVVITTKSGEKREGYMQPWDERAVYLTALDGSSAGSVLLSEISDVSFPEG